VSPKRFLQFLTVEHAKRSLAENRDMLTVTMDTGLSSPGRLHDLFVNVEAMTPGEFKLGGAGLEIRHGIHATPFGRCLLAVSVRGVCGLAFVTKHDDENVMLARLNAKWPHARLTSDQGGTEVWVNRMFLASGRTREPLHVLIAGTNFQMKVWEALLRIAPGGLASYNDVASMIGRPKAGRAVGSAIGHNDIAYLIPCHRVINKSGLIGNYRWGTLRKQAMISWEAAHRHGPAS
jgi:AraC family transcriptional regulator of adaptative response/methylated-DNA-[protein]-cysteine methyltransferase